MLEEVLKKIIAYYEEELDDPEIEIVPESNLMDDLELSSLEMFKSLVYLEVETGIVIPEKYFRRMITIQDVAEVICEIAEQYSEQETE